MKSILSSAVLLMTFVSNAQANEGEAKKFLANLAGEYKGRGMVVFNLSGNQERVSCKLKNNYDDAGQALAIGGKCATTQGKMDVNGSLKMQAGGQIVGSFISTSKNTQITQSTSSFNNSMLTLSVSMVNKNTGNLTKTRQTVTKNGKGGFDSVFYRYDNASNAYKKTGNVEFTPVK